MSVLKGERLAKARQEKGLTQRELAEEIGVTPETIVLWETGKQHPNKSELVQLAFLLDVSTDYLLNRVDTPKGILRTVPDIPLPEKTIQELKKIIRDTIEEEFGEKNGV